MNYKLYRFTFSTPVHFGDGKLETSSLKFRSDSLFSAMCLEAKAFFGDEGIQKLVEFAKSGKLIFSDMFPYCGNTYYLPKPMVKIEKEFSSSSVEKKKYKNTKFISVGNYKAYVTGKLDEEPDFAKGYTFTKVAKPRDMVEDPTPYFVSTYRFNDNCGLYFVVGYEGEEQSKLVADIMLSLGYTGIGGKISSGYGKFSASEEAVPAELSTLIDAATSAERKISISSCLPKDSELEKALEGASYLLQKRSGFVASVDYSDTAMKKRDLYTFAAGSMFRNTFAGDIYDVSEGGNHPVYRYAKPFFIGI